MVGQISLNTMVNGKQMSPGMARDPFEMSRFPMAVESSKGKTLDSMGRDIVTISRMLAAGDPDLERIDVTYEIIGGELQITSNQIHSTGYEAIATSGSVYRADPKQHVLRATLAVLKGKGKSDPHTMAARDIVAQWKTQRSGGSGSSNGGGSMSPMSGLLAVGTSYFAGRL